MKFSENYENKYLYKNLSIYFEFERVIEFKMPGIFDVEKAW